MLTAHQREEFDRSGIVRLPGAVAPERVKEMLDCVWDAVERRAEVRRDDPTTWKAQRMIGLQDLPKSVNFEHIASPAVCEALDAIFETRNWERPAQRLSMLVAFPESSGPWDVPHQNWHLDFPIVRGLEGNFAARIFVVLQKLNHAGGGTLFIAGSHRLLPRLVATKTAERTRSADARKVLMRNSPWAKALFSPDGKTDRVRRFVNTSTTIDGQEVGVVEMTGEPGDAFLTHAALLHSTSTNCSSEPRIVLSGSVYRDPSIANTIYGGDSN
ncbi:MAG TPA: phytanoyl-CoA dioxygenase family protein [Patescibacteria group bacterium]|nr:phytanoyl-CoA dioxygenase family protein [Patescibacteria group bacterium]